MEILTLRMARFPGLLMLKSLNSLAFKTIPSQISTQPCILHEEPALTVLNLQIHKLIIQYCHGSSQINLVLWLR